MERYSEESSRSASMIDVSAHAMGDSGRREPTLRDFLLAAAREESQRRRSRGQSGNAGRDAAGGLSPGAGRKPPPATGENEDSCENHAS